MEPIVRMALTGRHERVTAERARQLGILSEVVAPDELRPAAQRLASLIARNDPVVLRAAKQALWKALE
jgi:enoyl-CoA hydratase/carnithine racemase